MLLRRPALYTAIVAGVLISALGGSRMQIGGPTGAFVVIVAGIVAKFGVSGLALVTMMAGVMLVLMGLTGLGAAVKFIPRPVTIGFTNGIALLIASTQIKDFFGLKTGDVPSAFLPRMTVLIGHIGTTVLAGCWQFPSPRSRSSSCCLVLPSGFPDRLWRCWAARFVAALLHLPIETIGSKFGGIPAGFPHLTIPAFQLDHILPLFPSALTVALLAAVESLLSAVVADSMSGTSTTPTWNWWRRASPISPRRCSAAFRQRAPSHARPPISAPAPERRMAGMIHALTLLIILVVAAPLARFVPLATLAAVLFVVAYNMGEWREIGTILRLSKADIAVWAVTFALTVLADLTVAVEVGMVLAALLYIYRISQTTTVAPVTEEYIRDGRPHILQDKQLPWYVAILRIHGPFLFGTTEKLAEATADLDAFPAVVIVRLRNMTALDATGLHALEVFANRLRKSGKTLLLCGARDQPAQLLQKADFIEHIGRDNVVAACRSCAAARSRNQRRIRRSGPGNGGRLQHSSL